MQGTKVLKSTGCAREGFSLIELMVVLLIISTLLIFAVEEYKRYIAEARATRARADIEELVKSVRLFNIREPRNFDLSVFSPQILGNFVGTYLEKEPSRDPWGNFYQHSANLGVVFSCGPDGKAQTTTVATSSDDIVVGYLPAGFFITRAEYVDANLNNLIDFGDYVDVRFSRPAKLIEPMVIDFSTRDPEKALGSAIIQPGDNVFSVRIVFSPPFLATIKPGETRLFPRDFMTSIVDMSPEPRGLQKQEGVIIEKRKK